MLPGFFQVSPTRTPRRRFGRGVREGLAVLLLLAGLAVGGREARAQQGAITARATVLQPLQVSGVWSLEFQTVLRNRRTTVAPTNVYSGTFSVTGQAGAQIAVSFALPTGLVRVGGTEVMPIGTYTGCVAAVYPLGGNPCTAFTPGAAPSTVTLTGGLRFFYIGGTVDTRPAVAGTLPDGSYRGSIVMTASYTGN
jgi:hypothetical protein